MRIPNLVEIQKIELDILKFFKAVCEDNKLNYYLAYGTLIGAVRHKGFIPWDDDVDVFMPWEDYLRFVEVMKNYKGIYKLVSIETNTRFTAPLPKIIDTRTKVVQHFGFVERVELGIYIDIFILTGLGDTRENAILRYNQIDSEVNKWCRADAVVFIPELNKIRSFLRWCKNAPYRVRGIKHYIDRINNLIVDKSFYSSKYVSRGNILSLDYEDNIWLYEEFGEGCDVEFCGELFRAPINYDSILRKCYGDYMKLPPAEKRVSEHKSEIFVKDDK